MRFAIRKIDNKRVIMDGSFNRDYGNQFLCIGCGDPVEACTGNINEWYFRHIEKECDYSKKSKSKNNMSEFHREFQKHFHYLNNDVKIEKRFRKNSADVYYNGRVYEIQHSNITYEKIKERNKNYYEETGKKVIWILDSKTQNINNFPKDCLKVLVHENELEFVLKDFQYKCTYRDITHAISIIIDERIIIEEFQMLKLKRDLRPEYKISRYDNSRILNYSETIEKYFNIYKKYNKPKSIAIENVFREAFNDIDTILYIEFIKNNNLRAKECLEFLLLKDEEVERFTYGAYKGKEVKEVFKEDKNYFNSYLKSIFHKKEDIHHKEARGAIKCLINKYKTNNNKIN